MNYELFDKYVVLQARMFLARANGDEAAEDAAMEGLDDLWKGPWTQAEWQEVEEASGRMMVSMHKTVICWPSFPKLLEDVKG